MTAEAWTPRSWARGHQCPNCDPPTDWVRLLASLGRLLWLECRVCGLRWEIETPLSTAAVSAS
jgi:transcription elongation factor Elf1